MMMRRGKKNGKKRETIPWQQAMEALEEEENALEEEEEEEAATAGVGQRLDRAPDGPASAMAAAEDFVDPYPELSTMELLARLDAARLAVFPPARLPSFGDAASAARLLIKCSSLLFFLYLFFCACREGVRSSKRETEMLELYIKMHASDPGAAEEAASAPAPSGSQAPTGSRRRSKVWSREEKTSHCRWISG
jgi:hypothetical protein